MKKVFTGYLGFTLIELLVVVLIIGILASVALPKYQVAVDKARFMQALSDADALKKAEEIFYMANGRYTRELGELDLGFGYTASPTVSNRYQSKDGMCFMDLKEITQVHGNSSDQMKGNFQVWCWLKKNDSRAAIFIYMDEARMGTPSNPQPIPGDVQRTCFPLNGNARAVRLCKALGSKPVTLPSGSQTVSAYTLR